MKILIVTPRIPYPPYRGDKLKIYNLIRYLARNHEVSVITFYETEEQLRSDFPKIRDLTQNGVAVKQSVFSSVLNVGAGIFTRLPFQVLYYRSDEFHRKLEEMSAAENYDIIYFHLIRSTQYLPAVAKSNAVKIQDFTDAVSMYLERYRDNEKNPLRKFGLTQELKRVVRYENGISGFDKIYVCSEKDRGYLAARLPKNSIGLLLNGVNLETFKKIDVPVEENRIIFTGNMPYFANSDAAEYFCSEIFPMVLREIPNAKVYLVGQNPPPSVKNLASENVIVTGFVEDITAEYCKSVVNIAPIRFGAGTLNKVLEALALGLPTVSTSMAVSGLPHDIRSHIQEADTPQDFAAKVVDVLKNRDKYRLESEALSETVRKQFSWDTILGGFEKELEHLVEMKKRDISSRAESMPESTV